MKLLVTGAAGFIGTNVTIEAIKRDYTVVGFDNLHRPQTEDNLRYLQETYKDKFEFIHGDVRNESDFERIPEVVGAVHLAGQCGIPYAQINPRYDFEVNVMGTINVLETSRFNGKFPVAFAASNKCYTNIVNEVRLAETETRYEIADENYEKGFNEHISLDADGIHARSLYGTSKVCGDLYCQEYWQSFKVPVIIARMSCIYGLYQKGNQDQAWIDHFIRTIGFGDGKINIFGNGKQVRDMLWGDDVARFYLDAIENIDKVAGKPYNIGGGIDNTMSLLEAISEIEKQTSKKSELTFLNKRLGDQDIWISDITKIKNDLGWEPIVTPREGIERIIKQYEKMQMV